MKLFFLIAIFCLLGLNTSLAQTAKNPKVSEVEAHLTQKAVSFVKNRFPEVPILVNLSVTPLRRNQAELAPRGATEELPYYSLGFGNEAVDEWDDPSKSIHDLLPRIQSVAIQITMPQYISDDELFELRDALYSNLHIIPGRDKIEFVRKNWHKERALSNEWIIFLSSMVFAIFVLSFFSLRYFVGRLSDGLSAAAGGDKSAGAASPAPLPMPAVTPKTTAAMDGASGSMQFNETMRVQDKVGEILAKLSQTPEFPNLEDMIDLEQAAIKDPSFLGGILAEMPKDMQERCFALSSDPKWLEAFYEEAPLNIEHFHFVSKLAHRKRDPKNIKWEELLINLWRLGDDLKPFIRELEQRDALGILAWMPTTISVPTARETFPGGWGILLRHDFRPPPLTDKICDEMIKTCNELKPLQSMQMLAQFEHERGLLRYLRECSIDEERDIYKASKADASIHMVRPPFYVIFESGEETVKNLVERVPAREWGMAMFNVDRSLRGSITKHLNDSQNYILIETLKACDRDGVPEREIWAVRERIAKVFKQLQKEGEESGSGENLSSPSQESGDNEGRGPKVA